MHSNVLEIHLSEKYSTSNLYGMRQVLCGKIFNFGAGCKSLNSFPHGILTASATAETNPATMAAAPVRPPSSLPTTARASSSFRSHQEMRLSLGLSRTLDLSRTSLLSRPKRQQHRPLKVHASSAEKQSSGGESPAVSEAPAPRPRIL